MKVDILAIGVHPDDVELGCGGTLIASLRQGKSVAILDLTQGELGTRGTAATRAAEAAEAAKRMGISQRENLQMRDGFFEISEENILKLIRYIRKYRPDIILCNAPVDRHPDHGRSSELVTRAAFLSGLRRIETYESGSHDAQEAWRPKNVFHYIQDTYIEPDFVFDISSVESDKEYAVLAYATQFNVKKEDGEPQTYISTPDFMERMIARALTLGKPVGLKYAEGFLTAKKIAIASFDALLQHTT